MFFDQSHINFAKKPNRWDKWFFFWFWLIFKATAAMTEVGRTLDTFSLECLISFFQNIVHSLEWIPACWEGAMKTKLVLYPCNVCLSFFMLFSQCIDYQRTYFIYFISSHNFVKSDFIGVSTPYDSENLFRHLGKSVVQRFFVDFLTATD